MKWFKKKLEKIEFKFLQKMKQKIDICLNMPCDKCAHFDKCPIMNDIFTLIEGINTLEKENINE